MIIAGGIVIAFCIFLVFSYWYKGKVAAAQVKPWPPHISKCPEYWEVKPDDNTKCVNSSGVNGAIDSEVPVFNGDNLEEVQTNNAYTHWDGISNAV